MFFYFFTEYRVQEEWVDQLTGLLLIIILLEEWYDWAMIRFELDEGNNEFQVNGERG